MLIRRHNYDISGSEAHSTGAPSTGIFADLSGDIGHSFRGEGEARHAGCEAVAFSGREAFILYSDVARVSDAAERHHGLY